MIELNEDFVGRWQAVPSFDQFLEIKGEIFREVARRRTLKFKVGDKWYFIKVHLGVGWKEILKNVTQFRMPVLGAENEYRAIKRLHQLNVETMTLAGYGTRGFNPAERESFVITEALENTISLEDFCAQWCNSPPDPRLKRALITRVATIARQLHENGLNHRDLYICHFLLELNDCGEVPNAAKFHLFLIDLHRVQIRPKTPQRWIVKDLAALLFSTMNIGLTVRDLMRFLKVYGKGSLRQQLQKNQLVLKKVKARADALYSAPLKG